MFTLITQSSVQHRVQNIRVREKLGRKEEKGTLFAIIKRLDFNQRFTTEATLFFIYVSIFDVFWSLVDDFGEMYNKPCFRPENESEHDSRTWGHKSMLRNRCSRFVWSERFGARLLPTQWVRTRAFSLWQSGNTNYSSLFWASQVYIIALNVSSSNDYKSEGYVSRRFALSRVRCIGPKSRFCDGSIT